MQSSDITLESASYGGGCIEIYKDSSSANKRCEYLSSPEGKAVSPCLFTKLDNLVIRISEYLTVYSAVKLESELLSALESDANTVSSDFVPATGAPLTTEEVAEQTVWISGSGSKYHSKATCSGMKSPSEITLAEAEDLGFTPCKRCH